MACPVFVYDYGVVADVELGTLSGCAFFRMQTKAEGEIVKNYIGIRVSFSVGCYL